MPYCDGLKCREKHARGMMIGPCARYCFFATTIAKLKHWWYGCVRLIIGGIGGCFACFCAGFAGMFSEINLNVESNLMLNYTNIITYNINSY
jgi:hypothetical protein